MLGAIKKVVQREQRLESLREKRIEQNESELNVPRAFTRNLSSNILQEELSQKNSRYIAADVSHAVKKRDGCQCSFVSQDGRRCTETRHLHFDHKVPFALGGSSTVDNLRLLCPAHNRLEATKVFDAARIASIVQVARNESLAKRS